MVFIKLLNAYGACEPTEFVFSSKVFQKALLLEETEFSYTEPF